MHGNSSELNGDSSQLSGLVAEAAVARLTRKIRRHILPLLFLLYIVAYLDRINIGFAALTMNRQLSLTSQQYGLLSGIFFLGYFLFELPSNLIMHRVGARIWIARILVTWGLVSLATGFVQSAGQLYIARFLLGVAEAGFFPGMLLYLTYWFRQRDQAESVGVFMTALPVARIVGGPVSGLILDHVHAYSLASWRWLLILEALPALVCGLLAHRWLRDRPADASFLTAAERALVSNLLASEALVKSRSVGYTDTAWGALRQPRIWHLAACSFLFLTGLYVLGFWMPQAIRKVADGYSNTALGLLVMLPNLIGLAAMVLVSRSSDRRQERRYHAALSLALAAVALIFVGTASTIAASTALWSCAASGLYSFIGPFWALPGATLSGRSTASGLAFINSIGNLGGFIGLPAIGAIAGNGGLASGFRCVALALGLSALLILVVQKPET